jgi:hypothetical protein
LLSARRCQGRVQGRISSPNGAISSSSLCLGSRSFERLLASLLLLCYASVPVRLLEEFLEAGLLQNFALK